MTTPKRDYKWITCSVIKAGLVKDAREKLETNDSIDENDKTDKQGNVQQWNHCHDD